MPPAAPIALGVKAAGGCSFVHGCWRSPSYPNSYYPFTGTCTLDDVPAWPLKVRHLSVNNDDLVYVNGVGQTVRVEGLV